MNDIQQVLIPVDFHRHSDALADFAVGVANKLGARATLVHVVENVDVYADYTPDYLTKVSQELRDHAEKKMADFLEGLKAKCPGCEGVVLFGDAADSIVELAGERKADLIIMGTHGAKGIEKVLLGSVAERVLKRAGCPTLVYNPYRGERGYRISSAIGEAVQPV
jgi:nucleotide-binding universal stress UspA family protein